MQFLIEYAKSKGRTLITHTGIRRYGESTIWLLLERIVRILAGVFIGVLIARYLGPHDYGVYSYSLAVAILFMSTTGLGLDNVLLKDLTNEKGSRSEILGTALILKFAASITVFLLLYLFIKKVDESSDVKALILIMTFSLIYKSLDVYEFYFLSETLSRFKFYAYSGGLAAYAAVIMLLIFTGQKVVSFGWAQLAETVVTGYLYLWFFQKHIRPEPVRLHFSLKRAQSLLQSSWPLLLGSLVITVYMKIDQIMISNLIGNEANGFYSVAVRLSEVWYFIPVVLNQALFPAILNARKTDILIYKKRMQRFYSLLILISITVAAAVSVFAGTLIMLLFGSSYIEAAKPLVIHVWAGIFVSMGVASSSWYLAENLQHLTFVRSLIGMILNILLNYLLIPEYGTAGAAAATLVSQAFVGYFFDLLDARTRSVFMQKTKGFLLKGILWN